jgi:hypothetical protein
MRTALSRSEPALHLPAPPGTSGDILALGVGVKIGCLPQKKCEYDVSKWAAKLSTHLQKLASTDYPDQALLLPWKKLVASRGELLKNASPGTVAVVTEGVACIPVAQQSAGRFWIDVNSSGINEAFAYIGSAAQSDARVSNMCAGSGTIHELQTAFQYTLSAILHDNVFGSKRREMFREYQGTVGPTVDPPGERTMRHLSFIHPDVTGFHMLIPEDYMRFIFSDYVHARQGQRECRGYLHGSVIYSSIDVIPDTPSTMRAWNEPSHLAGEHPSVSREHSLETHMPMDDPLFGLGVCFVKVPGEGNTLVTLDRTERQAALDAWV